MSEEMDRAIIGSVARDYAATQGTCRFCGCHGDTCRLDCGDLCGWVYGTRRLCNGKACLIRADRENRSARRGRYARRRRAA